MNGRISTRTVIAEMQASGGVLAMFDDGTVIGYATAEALVRRIKRDDANAAGTDGGVVTTIKWRGVPLWWEPPS